MTKQELMETYTREQLAEMVEDLQKENLVELLKLKNREDTEDVSKVLDAMKLTITELCNTIEDLKSKNKQEKTRTRKTLLEFCDSVRKEDYENKINQLKSEVEKYRKAFECAKEERDCQIVEYQKKIEELEEYVNSLKCNVDRKQDAVNQIDGIICELFGIAHNGEIYTEEFKELLREKSAVGKTITDFLPTEPIKVADMLINTEGEYEHNPLTKKICGNDKGAYRIFDVSELRQIAEYLLVYCNHHKETENDKI